jgi:hypothetical protein
MLQMLSFDEEGRRTIDVAHNTGRNMGRLGVVPGGRRDEAR